MRPDEHKKKKNATYKKKHGIVKDTSDKKDEKTKKDKSTTENKHERHTKQENNKPQSQSLQTLQSVSGSRRHGTRDSPGVKAEDSSSDISSSDTENEDTSSRKAPSKQFRKRQIVSNWQKYELPPDEEERISGRGESYEKLLNMTGEAISHFRFKDELVWDDPGEAAHDSVCDAYSEFLSVNPSELAQSLACLPVHHILGISSNAFPDDQLSSMVNAAKNIRSQYTTDTQEEFTGNTSHSGQSEPIEASMNSRPHSSPDNDKGNLVTAIATASKQTKVASTKTSLLTPVASVNIQSHPVDTSAGSSAGLVGQEICNKDLVKSIGDRSPSIQSVGQEICNGKTGNTLKDPPAKLQLQDNDLDALLNPDNATDVSIGDRSPSIQSVGQERCNGKTGNTLKNPAAKLQLQDNDLDALLNSDNATDVSMGDRSPSIQSGKAKGDSKLASESEDLEAWLDSVLDD